MKNESPKEIERDIVAVFVDGEQLEQAIRTLTTIGVNEKQIGLLCEEGAVKDKLRDQYATAEAVGEDQQAARFVERHGTSSTVAATLGGLTLAGTAAGGAALIASVGVFGGALAVATAGTVVVGGLGALVGAVMNKSDADKLQEELDAGHILLVVRTGENRQKDQIKEKLSDLSSSDVWELDPIA